MIVIEPYETGFRGEADLMLVLKVDFDGTWEEIYFGDFAPVKEIASYSKRDNKFMVTLSKLKAVKKRRTDKQGSNSTINRSLKRQTTLPSNG